MRHYFDMYDHLLETGDAAPIKKLYGDYCSPCSVYVSTVELAYGRGNTIAGRRHLTRVRAYSGGAKDLAVVLATEDSTPLEEVTPDGERTLTVPGGKAQLQYNMSFQDGFWKLLDIQVPAGGKG